MKKIKINQIQKTIILFLLSIIYIVLVKYLDVKTIGPRNTQVGFATINNIFHHIFTYNELWYKITKYLGIIPILIVLIFGLLGLKQLIERRNILKVDKEIILLGCFYVLVGLVYILFEKVVINYRPVLLDGELEASFPSSHTLLAITISVSTIIMNKHYLKDKDTLKIANLILIGLMTILVIGRILSGVHWISDILGGIIISSFLLSLWYTCLRKIKE